MVHNQQIKIYPFPVLKTRRLVLRQLTENDTDRIFILRSDPSVNAYLDRRTAANSYDALAFIKKINEGIAENTVFYWGISLSEQSEIIGTICLWNIFPDQLTAEIGYELLPEFQGQGYIRECLTEVINFGFKNMKLKSIKGYVHPGNIKSIKVLKDFGFIQIENPAEGKEILYEKINKDI